MAYNLLDQREGEAGETYGRGEIVQIANLVCEEVHAECVLADRGWSEKVVDTVSITSGSRIVSLPSDCRMLRRVAAIGSDGEETGEEWLPGVEEDAGVLPYRAIHRPQLNQLYLTTTPSAATTLRTWYTYYPLPIVHGIVQGAGSQTLTIEAHESEEDDILIGRAVRIYSGTGKGQERTGSDYDAATKLLTLSAAWTSGQTPVAGLSRYTSRPDLPLEAKTAWLYRLTAMLASKNHRYLYDHWKRETRDAMATLKAQIQNRNRSGPEVIRDVMPGGFGDPAAC